MQCLKVGLPVNRLRYILPVHYGSKRWATGMQCSKFSTTIPLQLIKNQLLEKKGTDISVKIGCAGGFWGDTPTAGYQLIHNGKVDYIIFDYLSEITMSLLTAAKAKNSEFGYAPDFVSHAIGPHLADIKSKGIRIISNAGGINPEGCAKALKEASKKAGIDLKIGIVLGDNLIERKKEFVGKKDLSSGKPLLDSVNSINAYLGYEPIVHCLAHGADIVVTGRCTDSALALAPLVHAFGWKNTDYDSLACGSLAGHLIECGTQVTGGIYTDWEEVPDWDNTGFPIAEVFDNGSILIKKPPNTGGIITQGTVSEQLLYEIGDPNAYILPDVVCDFSQVQVREVKDGVLVAGARGRPPTNSYKVCSTYFDGHKATAVSCVGGYRSKDKALKTAKAIIKRCRNIFKKLKIEDFRRVHIQVIGSEDNYGEMASSGHGPREAALWISVHHNDKNALQIFGMEIASAGTGMAPGLTAMVGGRPKPSPLLHLHSCLIRKDQVHIDAKVDNYTEIVTADLTTCVSPDVYSSDDQPISNIPEDLARGSNTYTLRDLAYARSGDKGDSCNIGVIARKSSYLPYIQEALTKDRIANYFRHVFPENEDHVQLVKRYEVPGIWGLNFVLEKSLGGGGIASLRPDPQGKAYAQILLDLQIENMPSLNSLK